VYYSAVAPIRICLIIREQVSDYSRQTFLRKLILFNLLQMLGIFSSKRRERDPGQLEAAPGAKKTSRPRRKLLAKEEKVSRLRAW
jgi:hypothetical protein